MPKYLNITEARKNLLSLPDELTDEPIIITKHGKPVMVTVSYEQMESLLETLSILEDKEFSSQLSTSIQQDKAGEKVSWEAAKEKLGW
ncbi:MAG: type II toxin-antitoxin system Phd/YefM family antitoxin [Cyanobacteria bacterium P01_A01_bin.83]